MRVHGVFAEHPLSGLEAARSKTRLGEAAAAALAPFMVSRAIADAAIVAGASAGRGHVRFSGFAVWDFVWFRQIAELGYGPPPVDTHVKSPWPFFPLFPALLRAGWKAGVRIELVSFLVTHVAFFLALVGVAYLAGQVFASEQRNTMVWALALFPASFVFSLGYSEALFLALSVWAFAFAVIRRDALAGVCALGAALTRPNGIVVAAALLVAVGIRDRKRATLVVGPAILGVAVWLAILRHWSGDAWVFWHAKSAWAESNLWDAATSGHNRVHLALGVLGAAAIAVTFRRLPKGWTTLAVLTLIPPLITATVGQSRYTAACFPVFGSAALVADKLRRPLVIAGLVCSAGAMAWYAVAVVRWGYVP